MAMYCCIPISVCTYMAIVCVLCVHVFVVVVCVCVSVCSVPNAD